MSYADFANDPRYQKMKQRLGRIGPEQRAVMNTLSADATFADEQTRRTLKAMAQQADKEYADSVIGLKTRGLGLSKRAFGFDKTQDRMATGIGLGQVAAESYYGGKREDVENAILKKKLGFMNRLPELYGGV